MSDVSEVGSALSDHEPTPDWDTSVFADFCGVCGWPVARKARTDAWLHEKRNLGEWVDPRLAVARLADPA